MNSAELRINSERLRSDLTELAQVGRKEDRGIYRMAFSEGDMAGPGLVPAESRTGRA